jgi:hypothetical protein
MLTIKKNPSKEYTEAFGRTGLTHQKRFWAAEELSKSGGRSSSEYSTPEDARLLEQRLKSHVSIFQLHMMAICW